MYTYVIEDAPARPVEQDSTYQQLLEENNRMRDVLEGVLLETTLEDDNNATMQVPTSSTTPIASMVVSEAQHTFNREAQHPEKCENFINPLLLTVTKHRKKVPKLGL